MGEYIKPFLYLLDAPAKKTIPFLIISFLISSFLDVIGIGLIGVFLGLLSNPSVFIQKFPYYLLILKSFTLKQIIFTFGFLIVIAFILKAFIALTIQRKVVFFSQTLSVRLKSRLMTAYQHAPYIYYLQKNSAYMISRIQDNLSSAIIYVLMPILNLISCALITISILVFLFILQPILTSLLILSLGLTGYGYDYFIRRKLASMGKIAAVSNGEMIKSIRHGLDGLTEVRVLGRESYFLNHFNQVSGKFANAMAGLLATQQVPRYLVENMMAIFIIGVSLGGVGLGYNISNIVAVVGMFAAASARLLPTVSQILSSINSIRGYSHNVHLIYGELLELANLANSLPKQTTVGQNKILAFSEVSLQNIFYKYPNTDVSTIENISMKIFKGQSIGLIGKSGAGKSTLINIILGFLEPQKGQLFVDGKLIENISAWLNNFAYIPQSIFLLDDTLRKNIAFGLEESDIDEAKVLNVIKMAQLSEVLHQLPNGLETTIGEKGIRLSGGQRQRVALARALYHERDFIIMDEATSSLDNETEKEVIKIIKELKGNKTLIVIAHRLSTVEHCDVLFRLEQGRIIAQGSFEEMVGA